MWGNSLGWSISAVIALLLGGAVYLITAGTRATPPTDFSGDPRTLAAIVMPVPPPGALPGDREDADAGIFYRQAIELYQQNPALYENFADTGKVNFDITAAVDAADDLLMKGARCKRMDLFASHPQEIINYAANKKPLDALQMLGRVCVDRLGLLNQRSGNKDEALRHYQAAFALGDHLCRERITYSEFQLGLELISKSCAGMASLSEQSGDARATAIRD